MLLRSVEKHFQEGTAEPQVSPLRCAPVEMTKGRAVLPGTVVAEQEPFSSPWVGRRPMIPLSKIKLQRPGFEWVAQVSLLKQ